ncbi:EcsC family protein [Kribbella sp. NPDC023855]|uniref:EcsC family protein n=1 Tax=Kribbella sp. NPDC023855 TaxID=3154698 RepID=UPI0033CF9230
MRELDGLPQEMSEYERKRWEELQEHWLKKSQPNSLLPPKARSAMNAVGSSARGAATKAGRVLTDVTPQRVKDTAELAFDGALVPVVKSAVHLLELATEWTAELMDPETVLAHHRSKGHDVSTLADLRALDLKQLDDLTRRMALRWRTIGAAEGGTLGALALVPFAGGVAAITLDVVVMQVLSTAIATRVAYAYGFDAMDPDQRHLVDRMVLRAYKEQTTKAATMYEASSAFNAGLGRTKWSKKLREDQKLMAAVEKLMKQFAHGRHVPVEKVTKAIPVISVVAGAGTNAYVLGDVAKQATLFAQTTFLSTKYALPMPPSLRG